MIERWALWLERWFKWLNRRGKQTAWRGMLWHCRMVHEDRTALKQRVRELEHGLRLARARPLGSYPAPFEVE